MLNWLKNIFRIKRYSKFIFKEVTSMDTIPWGKKIPKKQKYKFIAEIESIEGYEASAEGYEEGIGSNVIGKEMRSYNTAIFYKFYEKIIPLEQAKQDFLSKLKFELNKKHYEEIN